MDITLHNETDTGVDIGSGAVTVGLFTTDFLDNEQREIASRIQLSNLSGSDSTITVGIVDSNGDYVAGPYSYPRLAANTTIRLPFTRFYVEDNLSLSVVIESSHASDSNITWLWNVFAVDYVNVEEITLDSTAADRAAGAAMARKYGAEHGLTVTGTLSPDATGDYWPAGINDDEPYFTDGTYFIWFDVTIWRISTGIGVFVDSWSESTPVLIGDYSPAGTYTGTATVALLATARVTLVDTTTINTDMRGTDSAALESVCTETRLAELDAANIPADVDQLIDSSQSFPQNS